MEYSDEYLRAQLPGEDPPSDYIPPDVTRELASYLERGDFKDPSLLARSVRWTYAIFSEFSLGNFGWIDGPSPWYSWNFLRRQFGLEAIVGLFDPDKEARGFGLSINIPGWDGPPFNIFGIIEFPRLRQRFPFAIRVVTTELHSAPNPVNATTTCWAQCNSLGAWGIITAGHAIGTSAAGLAVPLDNGSAGISYRSFWQPIDAAFVLTTAPPAPPSQLPILNFPAAGLPVKVECKSGAQYRTVASACNSLGFFQTRQFPILFFLDNPCVPGDSGALVRLTTGEAVGIYSGAQPSPQTGGTSGRVLNFAQAMFALDTKPYL